MLKEVGRHLGHVDVLCPRVAERASPLSIFAVNVSRAVVFFRAQSVSRCFSRVE